MDTGTRQNPGPRGENEIAAAGSGAGVRDRQTDLGVADAGGLTRCLDTYFLNLRTKGTTLLPTITEAFPPLPLEELTAEISNFSDSALEDKQALIKRLVMVHPTLGLNWGAGHRFRRARRLKTHEPYPQNVDGIIWRKDVPASQGRANPDGFSVLYLADRPDTALKEVRAESDQVVLADFEIVPGKSCLIAPIGELMRIQRSGRGFMAGEHAQGVSNYLNACKPQDEKSLLITDAFLLECLLDGRDNYEISSYVAKCIFDKNPKLSAIAYPSCVQNGAICFAVRTDHFWDQWGVRSVRCGHARHLSHGYYDFSPARHVNGIEIGGNFHWEEHEEDVATTVLLKPLWVPS
ncbi:hypothetical protein EGI20_01075 [Aquitalea sp. S1-19]|nr:hypothetical protein [Aquitalea sp. S1-19]